MTRPARPRAPQRSRRASRRSADRLVPLHPAFYDRPTERVARDLLGRIIETVVDGERCRARIVETEAYVGEHDPACHAAAGRTSRTEVLYGRPGRAYVYFVYGMHWCANAVTRRVGLPSAVLLRAAEPVEGVDIMRRRRGGRCADRDLLSGPGRLCQAMGISGPAHNGHLLSAVGFRILEGTPARRRTVVVTPRIGVNVAADWPLRFLVQGSRYVSARAQTARFLAQVGKAG